jgi:hypothetical protein
MTLQYALRWKKDLIAQLREQWQIVHAYNSVEVGTVREHDVQAAYDLATNLSAYMVYLKKELDRASGPSREMALEKAELVDLMTQVAQTNVTNGKMRQTNYYGDGSAPQVEYEAILRRDVITAKAKDLKRQISRLQVAIDGRNASTLVELDVPEYVEQPIV